MNIINLNKKKVLSLDYINNHQNNNEHNITSNINHFKINIAKIKLNHLNSNLEKKNKSKSDRTVETNLLNKYYWCELKYKKEQQRKKLLKNYNIINLKKGKRKIENSLYGDNTKLYDKINKVVRFWESFCNYAYPIIQLEKYKIRKKSYDKKELEYFTFENLKKFKLPKLYTNSSEKIINFNHIQSKQKSRGVIKLK